MSNEVVALLFFAGIAGGIMNALAGGATLITFPAMLAAGVPPLLANASNAVAVTPGNLMAAIADREKIPPFSAHLVALLIAAVGGGAAGAFLLFATPERFFTASVPALIGLGTLIFALSPLIRKIVAQRTTVGQSATSLAPAITIGVTSVYGGYFGAGLGVMLMAAVSLFGQTDMRTLNATKNLLGTAVSVATVSIFVISDFVSWPETLVLLGGAILGGLAGGHLGRFIPGNALRAVVIAIGCVLTVVYADRYWLAS